MQASRSSTRCGSASSCASPGRTSWRSLPRRPPVPPGSCPKPTWRRSARTGSRRPPIGAGPYKFVSFNPGVEMVLEAHERYWRKPPQVKRLVFRVVTEEATRLAMLKRGEVDVAYSIRGELAEDVKRTPGLKLAPTLIPATFWIDFTSEQWNPKSPWHDQRVRLAASLAIDRQAISQAETLGFSKVSVEHHPLHLRVLLAGAAHRLRSRAEPSGCWQKRAFRKVSTPASSPAMPPTATWPRPWSTTSMRWASRRASSRWSGLPGSANGARRRSAASCRPAPEPSAMPPPASTTT